MMKKDNRIKVTWTRDQEIYISKHDDSVVKNNNDEDMINLMNTLSVTTVPTPSTSTSIDLLDSFDPIDPAALSNLSSQNRTYSSTTDINWFEGFTPDDVKDSQKRKGNVNTFIDM